MAGEGAVLLSKAGKRQLPLASQIRCPNTQSIAAPEAIRASKLNTTKASRRTLSSALCGCALRSPARCPCRAIHAATVPPRATWASAVFTATRSSWIAASHNAPSSGANPQDGRVRERETSSTCACRKEGRRTTFGGSACLGQEVSPYVVTNAALAVATLSKSVPPGRLCLLRDQTWPFKPVCHNASTGVDDAFKVLRVAAFNR